MQIVDRIENCNGCGACIIGCKKYCIKMEEKEDKSKKPKIYEDSCILCNNCILYCPLYMPVNMPEFETFYEYDDKYYYRDMEKVYREALRKSKTGETTEFTGTLCQIAGLISLMGDKIKPNVNFYPLYCDPENPRREECKECKFIEK